MACPAAAWGSIDIPDAHVTSWSTNFGLASTHSLDPTWARSRQSTLARSPLSAVRCEAKGRMGADADQANAAISINSGLFEAEFMESVCQWTEATTFTSCLLYTSPSPRDGLLSR